VSQPARPNNKPQPTARQTPGGPSAALIRNTHTVEAHTWHTPKETNPGTGQPSQRE